MSPDPSIKQTVETILQQTGTDKQQLIPMLQALQKEFRYLPHDALRCLSDITGIPAADIAGVASFYSQFRDRPVGEHIIAVCTGTACHVKGANSIHDAFKRHLHLNEDQDTSADGKYTVTKVGCLGCCMLAPAIRIDSTTYGYLEPDKVGEVLRDFENSLHQKKEAIPVSAKETNKEIQLCRCSSCVASGAEEIYNALSKAIKKYNLDIRIKDVGCDGLSIFAPSIRLILPGSEPLIFKQLTQDDAVEILLQHVNPSGVQRFLCKAQNWLDKLLTDERKGKIEQRTVNSSDKDLLQFSQCQTRIATQDMFHLDPLDIAEYQKSNGFAALEFALKKSTPDVLLKMIEESRLRGRGGGGFPTALKMKAVRDADGAKKTVVCNGDEGDPGAFMDRMLLESCPYRIIEGITLAAFIVGADNGILYIRAEYPLAVERIRKAITACENANLLGSNILGSSFCFTLSVMEGAGAFVCGEETALLASIEGRRGMPRLRPPYPAQSGLHGLPTLINNVETCSLIPSIIHNGATSFNEIGTTSSTGTKVFSLAGKVRRGGLIEVPMGTTLRTIVEEIGGGTPDGSTPKAVQIGGPSGGCLPYSLADTPVDYEALTAQSVIMGSGGIVVLDEHDCMVDIARYFLEFTQEESCGRCAPCRVGTKRMLEILENLCKGKATKRDLEKLEHLAQMVSTTSLCGLGQTAPNPVLSTLHHFREEYEAHLEGRCPAGSCIDLINYAINDKCIGCTLCAQHCPVDAIESVPYEQHVVKQAECVRCGNCLRICPQHAVEVVSPCPK